MRQVPSLMFVFGFLVLLFSLIAWVAIPDWPSSLLSAVLLSAFTACGFTLVLSALVVLVRLRQRQPKDQSVIPVTYLGSADVPTKPLAKTKKISSPERLERQPLALPQGLNGKTPIVMAQAPPVEYVHRAVVYEDVIDALLDPSERGVVGIISEVPNGGRIGKTTLAQAVCYDERVLEAFPDGIFWVTLGELLSPDAFIDKVAEVVNSCQGEWSECSNVKEAQDRLRDVLHQRRALLVLDDAQRRSDVELFLLPWSPVVCLVTTRDEDVLPSGTRQVMLGSMRPGEAALLLGNGLSETEVADLADELQLLAGTLGYDPLLLIRANRALMEQLTAGYSAQQAIDALMKAKLKSNSLVESVEVDEDLSEITVGSADQDQTESIEAERSTAVEEDEPGTADSFVFPDPIARVIEEKPTFADQDELALPEDYSFFDQGIPGFGENNLMEQNGPVQEENLVVLDQEELRIPDNGVFSSPAVQERYAELAIFSKEPDIPLSAIEVLWGATAGMTPEDVAILCKELHQHKLLQTYDTQKGTVQLPVDVRQSLRDQNGTGQRRVHAALLEAYRQRCLDGQWRNGPRDGYFFDHLASHMAAAGQTKALADLLLDFDWMDAHLRYSGIEALLADYELESHIEQSTREAVWLVEGALRLAESILADDPDQLASQLWGRLEGQPKPEIKRLLAVAQDWSAQVWLRPVQACFNMPDDSQQMSEGEKHTQPVTAAAISPNGERFITGSADQTLKIWDATSGQLLHTIAAHYGPVILLGASRNNRRVASVAEDKSIKLWGFKSGGLLNDLRYHPAWMKAVPLTMDGERVVSSGADGTLKVWELETGRLLSTLAGSTLVGHNGCLMVAALSPDGRRLVSTAGDQSLLFWDVEKSELIGDVNGLEKGVRSLAITPDGRRAVVGSMDGTLRVCGVEDGQIQYAMSGHDAAVNTVAVTPDGCFAISGGEDGTLRVWDLENGHACASLTVNGPVETCVVGGDGRTVVAGGSPGDYYLLHLEGAD